MLILNCLDKIIENLKRFNPNFKIEIGRQVTNINKKVIKISFRMFKNAYEKSYSRRKKYGRNIQPLFNMEKQNEFEVGKQLYEMSIKNPQFFNIKFNERIRVKK